MFYLLIDNDTEQPYQQLCDSIPQCAITHPNEWTVEPVAIPTIEQLQTANMNLGEVAEVMYRGMTYDIAKPQQWLDYHAEGDSERYDLLRHTVWLYNDKHPYGIAAPLCVESKELLDSIRLFDEQMARELDLI